MKYLHFSTRIVALLLGMIMLFSTASCAGRTQPPDDEPPEAQAKIPVFINLLPDIDLSKIAQPQPPAGDLIKKMNTAYNQNNDVVGWLSIPNTTIDNEVLSYTDNLFYERRDITKGYNWYGSYWADYECVFGDRNTISKNTIIYGHSMDDNPEGLKFSQLKKYLNQDFVQANPYIYFSTPEDNMVWKVFSVMVTDIYFKYIQNPVNMSNADFMKLVTEAKDRSKFDFNVDIIATDKILTLSTCTYPTNNKAINDQTRYVIMARLMRPGEVLESAVGVSVNQDVKNPQYR